MKFLKRLLALLLIFLLIATGVNYYYGLHPNHVEKFIVGLFDSETVKSDTIVQVKLTETNPKKEIIKETKKKAKFELQPLPINPFEKIDQHARNCPDSLESDITLIANYLLQVSNSDIDKARAIYIWLTDNIIYDDDAYNTGNYGDYSAEGVIVNRKAVCEGFSNLYLAIGLEMDLEILKVSGYAKGYSYTVGTEFFETNHAWNLIKIKGDWRLFDATWGQGYGNKVDGKLVSTNEFDNYWFNVDPYEGIFSHLPDNQEFLLVTPALDLKSYEKLPQINKAYFELGFEGKETYQAVFSNNSLEFPQSYQLDTYIKKIKAPKYKSLQINKLYEFEFYIPRGISVAIIDSNSNWTFFNSEKGKFILDYRAVTNGKLEVSVKYENGGYEYLTLLIYNVEESQEVS